MTSTTLYYIDSSAGKDCALSRRSLNFGHFSGSRVTLVQGISGLGEEAVSPIL